MGTLPALAGVGAAPLLLLASTAPTLAQIPPPPVVEVMSEAMDAPRRLSIFRGAACRETLEGCVVAYMADGDTLHGFLRRAPADAATDRLVVVGIHNDHTDRTGRARPGELLRDADRGRYRAFERFVAEELIAFVEGEARRPAADRWVVGYSNGGAWAIDMLERRRDLFGGAAAFSVADQSTRGRKVSGARAFLGAGRQESLSYGAYTRASAEALRSAGANVEERYVPGDHSPATWAPLFWWWAAAATSGR